MTEEQRRQLRGIKTFAQLIGFLRDQLDWPIDQGHDEDDLTFDWSDDLGLKDNERVAIKEIKQLRPLETGQPWGIFFVSFEKKQLPIVILRRILNALVLKKRAGANQAQQAAWQQRDLLFISAYGRDDDRQLTFAHFSEPTNDIDASKATLRVLGWDDDDTSLKLDYVADTLKAKLTWPRDTADLKSWRQRWSEAFQLRHHEVIDTAADLALRLAELAKRIRNRMLQVLPRESEKGDLRQLLRGFKDALIHDLDEAQFADMYAQTITYGLFSAAVSRTVPGAGTTVLQENVVDMVPVTNPFLREMLQSFLKAGGRRGKLDFDELGIQEVVDLLNDPKTHMDAVLRDFGNRTRGEDPVIHFYEAFLKAYDKKLKVQRGVFYTPQPVVSYIVRSVHELLQTEFGLADGLADTTTWGEMLVRQPGLKLPPLTDAPGEARTISPDEPFVQILDPATGTATFLVEVIDVIYRTLKAKWQQQRLSDTQQGAAWNEYVPKCLLPRLHAYELMMAPYAIAHMKIGLKLAETGYRFGTDERARIYLTNTLEPWLRQIPLIGFEALAHEAAAVNEIKRYKRFTVIVGNPPYSIQSQNLTETARAWANPYRYLNGELIKEKGALQFEKALQDDCVKFASFSQQKIIESANGVLGLIMSHSFVDNPTLRGMRQNLGQTFNSIYVIDLHGNSTKKERCPDGSEDKNVFDIRQGVGILIGSLQTKPVVLAAVRYGETWGTREFKYAGLEKASISTFDCRATNPVSPEYLFKPQSANARDEFGQGFKVTEIFIQGSVGIITARDNLVVDLDPEPLVERATVFRDSKQSNVSLCETLEISMKKGWDIDRARAQIKRDRNLERFVRSLCYRPFDTRFIFYHTSLVWGMSYPTMRHMLPGGNLAMMVGRAGQVIGQVEWDILFCTRGLTEFNLYRRGGHNLLPLYLVPEIEGSQAELDGHALWRPNLSPSFLRALATTLRVPQRGVHGLPASVTPEDIFHYIYAVFHGPSYRSRYAEFLKIDFPRLPLTGNLELFQALAQLGGELTGVHLLESRKLAQPITELVSGRSPDVEKVSWLRDTVWLDKAQTTGFCGVPEAVWNFHIGGYQVCEKWLKDRKGRTLSADDIAHYQKIVVALSETIRLMAEIDRVIDAHGGWPGAFQTASEAAPAQA